MNVLAFPLIIASVVLGAVAADQFVSPGARITPDEAVAATVRAALGACALAAAFTAGCLL